MSLGSLLTQISSISNVSGNGIPVQTYASTMQKILTSQMTAGTTNQLSTIHQTNTALGSLKTALQQLQSATQSLASSTNWSSVTATSSNTSAFTVQGGSGAMPSDFNVNVLQTAQSQMDVSNISLSTATGASSLTGGTFYITGGSGTATITVTANESLSGIVNAVNADKSSTHVQAFILGNNQLAFESTLSGAANGFSLVDASGSNFISTQVSMTQTQPGLDAELSLGGVTVTSVSNQFSNIVPGVTLTVSATGSGMLSVQSNTTGAVSSVESWMSAYNKVVDLLHSDTQYIPPTGTATSATVGPLLGDPSAGGILSQLPNAVESLLPGTGTLQSLSAVGIVLDPNNGHLEFQSSSGFKVNGQTFSGNLQDGKSVFESALQSSGTAVQALFGVVTGTTLQNVIPTAGVLGNVNNVLNDYLGFGSSPGIINNELQSNQTQTDSLNKYLGQLNQMITSRVNAYTAQLNSLNASLQKSQSQMQMISAMFNSSSSSSSSGSGSSSSSSGG